MTHILIVEDEESYRDPLTFLLEREGYDVTAVANGSDALTVFERASYGRQIEHGTPGRPGVDHGPVDLILLDLMLPGISGIDVCSRIRQTSSVPIIMLTAKDSEIDKVVGLEIGADDYVTKPYSSRELLARIKAVLRRGADAPELDDDVLTVGDVTLDADRHTVTVRGEQVQFPLKEFELLEFLMRNSGRVMTRGQLLDRVWGMDYVGDSKTLDVHIKRIRAKIEANPSEPVMLLTVRGLGYRLIDDE